MPYDAPPNLAEMTLPQIAEALAARRLPPIDQWDPAEELDSHMVIRADGTWLHEGRPITRPAMVRAFSSLLVQRDGQHFLLTPQCRQRIAVEDAAFVAVDVEARDGTLAFRLNTDELVLAGPGNPLRAEGDADCPAIYLAVRHGTQARINRSTWLQLVALADFSGPIPVVSSQGADFALVP
ncbi:DUF1285 domain-containing protein [Alteraurantiacibacter buctensis]|uniref:DUF1285 domain-containing protein n=1 Tax=Alteraurantiacibacter buctensis TaxID=1503981 RepID=A0A844YWC0_9SPHN|nr:DUF1285 domain-containing protein [Alteraurantiacibacter buctensis]MXO72625.1 DUF1285 domain-containing protein [Alteraurantiacibacter buctensis]